MQYRACAFVLALTTAGATLAQWVQLPMPVYRDLEAVDYDANGLVWIGSYDTISVSNDHGNTFTMLRPMYNLAPIMGYYSSVTTVNASTAFITGTMNTATAESIYRTTDGGATWSLVHYADIGLIDILYDVEMSQYPLGFAVGTNGRILRTTNGGGTWTGSVQGTQNTYRNVHSFAPSSFVASANSTVRRTVNQGNNWITTSLPGATGLAGNGYTCYAVNGTTLYKSINGGNSWSPTGTAHGSVMAVANDSTLFAADTTGIYRSRNSGQYWEKMIVPNYRPAMAMDMADDQRVIVVGENGFAVRSDDQGGGPGIPEALFSHQLVTTCGQTTVVLTATGDPALSMAWFVDGVPAGSGPAYSQDYTTSTPMVSFDLVVSNGLYSDTMTWETGVMVYQPPTADAGPDLSPCTGWPTRLQGSGNGSFFWQPSTGLSSVVVADPVVTITSPQQYVLRVSNAYCYSTDTVLVAFQQSLSDPDACTVVYSDSESKRRLETPDSLHIYAMANGGIRGSWDGGDTWFYYNANGGPRTLEMVDAMQGYSFNDNVGFRRTANGWSTPWNTQTPVSYPLPSPLTGAQHDFIDVGHGYSAMRQGTHFLFKQTTDSSATWQTLDSLNLNSTFFLIADLLCDTGGAFIATGKFTEQNPTVTHYLIMTSFDQGYTWDTLTTMGINTVDLNVGRSGMKVVKSAPNTYHIFGERGFHSRSTDGGHTWSIGALTYPWIDNPTVALGWFTSPDTGYACGNEQWFRTENGGECWTEISLVGPQPGMYWDVEASPDGTVFCLLDEAGSAPVHILKLTDGIATAQVQQSKPCPITAFPNPANDNVHVQLYNTPVRQVQLIDLAGRCVRTHQPLSTASQITVPVHGLAPGTYFLLVLDSEGNRYTQQVVLGSP